MLMKHGGNFAYTCMYIVLVHANLLEQSFVVYLVGGRQTAG